MRFDRLELAVSARVDSEAQLEARPDDRDERHWHAQALQARRAGDFEGALRNYSRALEVDKSFIPGWVGQVRMLIAMKEYPEAVLWSGKALELFKNNAELLAGRAQSLCREREMKLALASCDAALAQPGMFSYPWIARGELMLATRQSTAEYCFDKAIQADSDWLVQMEIASVYLHYGRPARALPLLRIAADRAGDYPDPWYQQGRCELAMGLITSAEKSFAHCLQILPNHADCRRELLSLSMNRRSVRRWFRRTFFRR